MCAKKRKKIEEGFYFLLHFHPRAALVQPDPATLNTKQSNEKKKHKFPSSSVT